MFLHYLGKISTCLTTGTGCISTKLFVLEPDAAHLCEHQWRTLRPPVWLSCSSCQVLSFFLTLRENTNRERRRGSSEFHVNHVNECLYCINCLVCYKVQELRSSYDAKLQHVFFNIFFRCISAKKSKPSLKTKKNIENVFRCYCAEYSKNQWIFGKVIAEIKSEQFFSDRVVGWANANIHYLPSATTWQCMTQTMRCDKRSLKC